MPPREVEAAYLDPLGARGRSCWDCVLTRGLALLGTAGGMTLMPSCLYTGAPGLVLPAPAPTCPEPCQAPLAAPAVAVTAMCQHDVLTELNEDPDRRQQLRGFCAAYLGVEVDDVLVTQADRLGFVLLGRPTAPAAVTAAAPQGGESGPAGAARGLRRSSVQRAGAIPAQNLWG